jgi:O-antigen/teichoic acid export membrane protein
VRGLGIPLFGAWSWILAITGLAFQVLDPGFSLAGSKYLAEVEPGDSQRVGGLLSAMLVANAAVGVVGGIVLLVSAGWLVTHFLNVPRSLESTALNGLRLAAPLPLVSLVAMSYAGVLRAMQRLDWLSAATVLNVALMFGGGAVVVHVGLGLDGLIVWQLITQVIFAANLGLMAWRLAPGTSPAHLRLTRADFRRVASYGSVFFFMSTLDSVTTQLHRVLLGALANAAQLGYFAVAYTVASRLQLLVAKAVGVTFPRSSQLHSAGDWQQLRALYMTASRGAHVLALAGGVPLMVFCKPILSAWLGPTIAAQSAPTLVLLVAAFVLLSYTVVPHYMLNGLGRARVNLFFVIVTMALLLPLSFALIPGGAAHGAALALLIAYAAGALPAIAYTEIAVLKINWHLLVRTVYAPALVTGGFVAGLGLGLTQVLGQRGVASLVAAVSCGACIALGNLVWSVVRTDDPLHTPAVVWVRRVRVLRTR